jgi:ribosomal protein L19E
MKLTSGDSIVTEEEIRHLLAKGPVKTKDLVHTFRAKLKKDSANLHRIKDIIRKIGVVKPSTDASEGENIVYLKE